MNALKKGIFWAIAAFLGSSAMLVSSAYADDVRTGLVMDYNFALGNLNDQSWNGYNLTGYNYSFTGGGVQMSTSAGYLFYSGGTSNYTNSGTYTVVMFSTGITSLATQENWFEYWSGLAGTWVQMYETFSKSTSTGTISDSTYIRGTSGLWSGTNWAVNDTVYPWNIYSTGGHVLVVVVDSVNWWVYKYWDWSPVYRVAMTGNARYWGFVDNPNNLLYIGNNYSHVSFWTRYTVIKRWRLYNTALNSSDAYNVSNFLLGNSLSQQCSTTLSGATINVQVSCPVPTINTTVSGSTTNVTVTGGTTASFSGAAFTVNAGTGTLQLTQTGTLSLSGVIVSNSSTGRTVDQFFQETSNSKNAPSFVIWAVLLVLLFVVAPLAALAFGWKYGMDFFNKRKNGGS